MYKFSNKLNKKGQLTLFVIIALIILFSLAFLIYAKNKIVTAHMVTQADRQIKEYIDSYAINQYVTSCLDVVSQEVLIEAMSQGGQFNFKDSNNYIEFNDTTYNRTVNVSIVVDTNNNCPDGRNPDQHIVYNNEPDDTGKPDYPYYGGYAKVKDLESKYYSIINNYGLGPKQNNCTKYSFNQYSGFFGINNLTRLCDSNGANRAGVVLGTNSLTCDYYNNINSSLQQAIERQIEKEIVNCINFTEFRSRSAGNSNITNIGDAKAVLTFKPKGYNIKLVYPFTILMTNRQPITRMIEFGVDKDIPFKELYEYTYELLNYDVKYAEFSILQNYTNVISKLPRRYNQNIRLYNYSVDIIKGNITNDYTDILRVIDTEHKIVGVPLTINLGIHERRPVLDYIHNTANSQFDIVVIENDVINLNPQGYDPDDDNISYYYTGWLEDYTDKYDDSTDECKSPANMNVLKTKCMVRDYKDKPRNWTKSIEYKTTHQSATYTTLHKDLGPHQVKITIMDEHGLKDNQIVNILVFDLPTAVINVTPAYEDIPKGFASYEDKFSLDAGESKAGVISTMYGSKLNTLEWKDRLQLDIDKTIQFYIIKSTALDDMKLLLPDDDERLKSPIWTMINVINYAFEKIVIPPPTREVHIISLTVNETMAGLTATTSTEINVTQCLNHTSSTPEYPYNTNPDNLEDSLNSNHTCCTNYLIYASSNTKCFESTQYGGINSFTNYKDKTDYADNALPFTNDGGKYGSYTNNVKNDFYQNPLDNDIYIQTFERRCSGDRGNICSGDGINIISPLYNCNDNNYGTGGDERCSGPPADNIYKNSEKEIQCQPYDAGTTFESLTNHQGTGYCNNQKTCDTDKQFCKRFCDGNGGCTLSTDCECNSNNCGTSPECNNNVAEPSTIMCKANGFFKLICSQCMLVESTDNICISDDGSNGCTADKECNGSSPLSKISTGGCTSDCKFDDCAKKPGTSFDTVQGKCI